MFSRDKSGCCLYILVPLWFFFLFLDQVQRRRSWRISAKHTAQMLLTSNYRQWSRQQASWCWLISCCQSWLQVGTKCWSSPRWCAALISWRIISSKGGQYNPVAYITVYITKICVILPAHVSLIGCSLIFQCTHPCHFPCQRSFSLSLPIVILLFPHRFFPYVHPLSYLLPLSFSELWCETKLKFQTLGTLVSQLPCISLLSAYESQNTDCAGQWSSACWDLRNILLIPRSFCDSDSCLLTVITDDFSSFHCYSY